MTTDEPIKVYADKLIGDRRMTREEINSFIDSLEEYTKRELDAFVDRISKPWIVGVKCEKCNLIYWVDTRTQTLDDINYCSKCGGKLNRKGGEDDRQFKGTEMNAAHS